MLKPKIEKAINEQINKELYSAYLYQAMSAHAANIGLEGIANWMDIQAQEEMTHARKFYDYILEQGGKIELVAIEKPDSDYQTVKDMFEKTLAHEKLVTASIHDLVYLAREERDYATEIFLSWFVTEQVEEESNVNAILDKLKLIGDGGNGLFMIDKDLSTRVFTSPVA
ncbi:MAG: ferritin [Candidatus Marinimicrobia bacterium]|nr:ferritin [Candidatus Neomarinimicrobiota bacterium]